MWNCVRPGAAQVCSLWSASLVLWETCTCLEELERINQLQNKVLNGELKPVTESQGAMQKVLNPRRLLDRVTGKAEQSLHCAPSGCHCVTSTCHRRYPTHIAVILRWCPEAAREDSPTILTKCWAGCSYLPPPTSPSPLLKGDITGGIRPLSLRLQVALS